jgi:hypothetical protein
MYITHGNGLKITKLYKNTLKTGQSKIKQAKKIRPFFNGLISIL